ncbi:hypothetical protein B0H63DRAFT_450562 [Podospora didyma]|uniref:Ankyrin repeat protein n=1 Tax=Podospora didyma TaxID=330526 RepID=A0AAE0NGN0_9PEZI|nr:hypothetical protein B0H63DRAFT_450562 [Podospora didyma]
MGGGCDPSLADRSGKSALSVLVKFRFANVLASIAHEANVTKFDSIEGADLEVLNQSGQTPLHMALETISPYELSPDMRLDPPVDTPKKTWEYLQSFGRVKPHEKYPLYAAATCRTPMNEGEGRKGLRSGAEMIRLPLAHGANPYAHFRGPGGPRTNSTGSRSIPGGSDESEEEFDNLTVIHETISLSQNSRTAYAIEPFLELQALDLERRDSKGQTLLLAACRSSLAEMVSVDCGGGRQKDQLLVEVLIDRGADVAASDNKGRTALHLPFIFLSGEKQIPQDSLQAGGSHGNSVARQKKNSDERTPWQLLEEAGADFMIDNKGRNLLQVVAQREGSEDWFEAFISKGLDPASQDNDRLSSLDVAAACGNEIILAMFEKDGDKKVARLKDRGDSKTLGSTDTLTTRRKTTCNNFWEDDKGFSHDPLRFGCRPY